MDRTSKAKLYKLRAEAELKEIEVQKRSCTKETDCLARSHYGDCLTNLYGKQRIIGSAADQESILQTAQRLIFGDRREEYGHPLDDYTRTAGMVNACFAHILKRPMTPEECMTFMILVKVSRYQETQKRDTLVDMAGYCGTIGEAQAERARRALKARSTEEGEK